MDKHTLADKCALALNEKLGNDIVIMKVENETVLASYFVICHGRNTNQVRALSDEVEFRLSLENVFPYGKEGYASANWIILDYGDVIVHVFDEESRNYFKLEKLWSAGEIMPLPAKENNEEEK